MIAKPIIETERFLLRRITLSDAEDLFKMRSNKEVMQFIGKPLAKNITDAEQLITTFELGFNNKSAIVWGITFKNQHPIIGTISFHDIDKVNFRSELGYMLNSDYWRQGVLSEVLPEVIKFGFNTLNLHSIEARIAPENSSSKKLLLKNNFVKEAYFKENYFFNQQFLDTEVYSLINQNEKK